MKTSLLKRNRASGAKAILGLLAFANMGLPLRAASNALLWQIGQPDHNNREFALAPNHYSEFHEDGFFVVGRSDARRDWPYVHPGPHDAWAGSRSHTFTIMFGVQKASAEGECKLLFDLIDTQNRTPPELRIEINGRTFKQTMPKGAGDASVGGEPAKGKAHHFEVGFPASLLRDAANEIDITTVSGSWILYDWIGLEAPFGTQLADAAGTVVSSVRSPPVLLEREGKLFQTVQLSLRHFGGKEQGVILLDGKEATNLTLQASTLRLELPVLAVQKERPIHLSVEVAGKTVAAQTLALKPVRKWIVYLLPHSHVDIGYTHVQTDVERLQWKNFELAMDTASRTATNPIGSRFKWNVEVLWAVDSYLKQASPQRQQQFVEAVKAGQMGLEALYGNELTGLCRPEELLRLVGFAQRLSQRVGMPIESAMITDVPGYTWGIVPTFAHSGIKYFSIGPNGGDRIGHTIAAWGDKPFWWIGPNGRDKVLVWMTGTGYYQVFQSPDKLMDYLARLEEKDYPYDMVQVRHCLGDNGAPDLNFADKVKTWNETHAYPKLVIATADDMFHAFEKRYGDKIPSARGDFTPYWEDGAASSARETALNRASAERLTQAETLFAMLNPKGYPAEDFYQAWRNVLLYDEHTWGAHNSISQPDAPFAKSQWAIKQANALDADKQSHKLLEAANASRGTAPRLPPDMQAVDVINTGSAALAWALVTVPKDLSTAGDGVVSSLTNRTTLVSQRLTSGELVFRPCCGNFFGHRWYITSDRPAEASFKGASAEGATLTTSDSAAGHGLALRLDEKTGAIASLIFDGHELVDTRARTALNDYFYLPGSDLKGLQRNGPVKISVKERGPLVASLLVESDAPGCRRLTREIRVHALRNYVEIINTVDKAPVRTKEGVHFGFGFNVPGGEIHLDVPWGVVRPELDQIPGACKNWFALQRYVDVSNPRFGVTWLTPDAPLVEVGGVTANLIGSLSDPRAWLDHVEPSQTIYSWAMNNHWHTNYRADQEGPTVFRYLIWPHEGGFDPQEATRLGLECSQPLLAMPARGEAPAGFAVVVSNRQVLASAFKPSEDGKAWILRLFGASGKAARTALQWAAPVPKTIWLSDNSEQPKGKAPELIDVPPFGIVTLRAEFNE